MKNFDVPVWFNVNAETAEDAWQTVSNMLWQHIRGAAYSVEEPVQLEEIESGFYSFQQEEQ